MAPLVAAVKRFSQRPYSRATVVGCMLGLGFIAVTGRLLYLQAFATGTLSASAKTERTARKTLPHRRGGIYDREGNVLARSVDAVDIAVHPYTVTDVNATANVLVSMLGGDAASYVDKLTEDTTFTYIQRQADPDIAEALEDELTVINWQRINDGLEELASFEFEDTSKRIYTMGNIAGNVIGVVGIEGHGLTGLELEYDDILSGTDGYLIQERGVNGTPIVGGEYERVEPVDGENIVISIDCDIQRAAQEQLSEVINVWGAGDGCCVVMQPETGEIYACASTPYLDPSDTSAAPTEAFNLRAVSDAYEPGSVIKPLLASMCIDTGVATPDTVYYVPATIEVGDDEVHDADERAVGMDMSLTNVLECSSNVGAVLFAESVGPDIFCEYLDRFQLGHLTGIDFPGEAYGLVPDRSEYTGAWMSMAFGQGLAVSPIQLARAEAAIANEGILTTPHFLINRGGTEVTYPQGDRVISTSTAEQVAEIMNSVIENGYAYLGGVEGYRLSGKTGTAERASETGGYLANLYTESFIGFGPTDDPKVLVYMLVDYLPDITASDAIAPWWSNLMRATLEKLQIAPTEWTE